MIVNEIDVDKVTSIAEVLSLRAELAPDSRAFTFLNDGKLDETHVTFSQINTHARNLASLLQQRCRQGDRVLIVAPNGIEYIYALFACFYSGVIAVPVYPPANENLLRRLISVMANCSPVLALATSEVLAGIFENDVVSGGDGVLSSRGNWIEIQDAVMTNLPANQSIIPGSTDIALLQYTSGSTSSPKGVIITHGNLIANEKTICRVFSHDGHSVGVGWLPFHHDMGLIGNLLQTVFVGMHTVLMGTHHFVREPLNWLRAISRFRASTSGGPNFAYELLARRLERSKDLDLDLSSWKVAFCGAEPIRAATIERFLLQVEKYAFCPKAFSPCYGLAEATLMVCGSETGAGAKIINVDDKMLQEMCVEETEADSAASNRIVSCGNVFPDQNIYIFHRNENRMCRDNEVGEICISGANVTQGYWNDHVASTDNFIVVDNSGDPAFRTGDLGFRLNGHIYVSGRLKDLIIINGRNYFPQDIENSVVSVSPALRFGSGASFSVEVEGKERLVIVQEIGKVASNDVDDLMIAIGEKILAEYNIRPHSIILIRRGTIPKTTSGKIQRGACKDMYERQVLQTVCALSDDTAGRSLEHIEQRPGSPLRQKLYEIVAECCNLDIEQATATDVDKLIVDSIQLIQLKSALEQAFSVSLDLELFFKDCTYEKLEKCISSQNSVIVESNNEFSWTSSNSSGAPPLTLGQQSLWYLQNLDVTSTIYNIAKAFDISPPINALQVKRSIQQLSQLHPVLNTTMSVDDMGRPIQLLTGSDMPPVFEVDGIYTKEEFALSLNQWANMPFDLDGGRLFRVIFYQDSNRTTLLFVFHHLICDFQSLKLMLSDLLMILNYQDVQRSPNQEYYQFIESQRSYRESTNAEEDRNYWKQHLRQLGIPRLRILDTPAFRRDRQDVTQYQTNSVGLEVLAIVAADIKKLAGAYSCSAFAMVLASLQAYLSIYLKQPTIATGTAVTLRQGHKFSLVSGYCVNPVPFVQRIKLTNTVSEQIDNTIALVNATMKHSRLALPDILKAAGIKPAGDREGLFDVIFTYLSSSSEIELSMLGCVAQSPGKSSYCVGEVELTPLEISETYSQFPLEFRVIDAAGSLHGEIVYRKDLFDSEFIHMLATGWQEFSRWFFNNRDLPLAKANEILPAYCASSALSFYDPIHVRPESSSTLHELFESQSDQYPEAIAIAYRGQSWCYRILDEYANQIAHLALKAGCRKGDVAVVIADCSPKIVGLLLGLSKIGVCFVCLAKERGVDHSKWIIQDCRPTLVFIDGPDDAQELEALSNMSRDDFYLIDLDDNSGVARDIESMPKIRPNLHIESQSCAYYAYTSGSTGRPKGIIHNHANLVSFIRWQSKAFGIGKGINVAQQAAMGFDVAYCEIFGAICYGASLQIAEAQVKNDPVALVEHLFSSEVCVLQLVPSYFHKIAEAFFLQDNWRSRVSKYHIQHLLFVGEPLSEALIELAFKMFPKARLYNVYGPTECVAATCFEVIKGAKYDDAVPAGTAVAGRTIQIMSDNGSHCGVNQVGEIYIGGPYLALGYLNLAEVTETAFISTSVDSTDRLYRSGDFGKFDAAGQLYIVGRKDNQVKVNGVRVELEEVERRLRQCQGVDEVCCFVDVVSEYVSRICACIVFDTRTDDKLLALSHIKVELSGKISPYMMPSLYYTLDLLPTNVNGKIDRLATKSHADLHLLQQHDAEDSAGYNHELFPAIKKILNIDVLDVNQNFFEVGGNSLLAMQLVNYIKKQHGVGLDLQQVFGARTIFDFLNIYDECSLLATRADEVRSRQMLQEVLALSSEEVEKKILELQ